MAGPAGVFTALVTPFIRDKIDEAGLAENIRFQIASGVQGLVVLGSTGEGATLTDAERERVIQVAVKAAGGRVPVVAGTGDNATHRAIAKIVRAQQLGADLALVVTPYYNRPTQQGLFLHYKSIAESTSLPFLLYNVPTRTGVNLEPETIRRLFSFSSIIGIKEEFAQIAVLKRMAMDHRPDFAILSGNDVTALPEIALGAQGVISAVSNLVPADVVALTTAMLEGRYDDARHWHYRLLPLFQAAFLETNPAPIKAAMAHCGMAAGPCRLPLTDLLPENWAKLERVLKTLGGLNHD